MNTYALSLLHRHRGGDVIVDSNLLILLVIGLYDPLFITRFRNTSQFRFEGFERLGRTLDLFATILVTPNILTEVSNMANQAPERVKSSIFARFGETVRLVLQETHLPSREVVVGPHFERFGLTDVGIARLAMSGALVLTIDKPLVAYLQAIGTDALDFNDLR